MISDDELFSWAEKPGNATLSVMSRELLAARKVIEAARHIPGYLPDQFVSAICDYDEAIR